MENQKHSPVVPVAPGAALRLNRIHVHHALVAQVVVQGAPNGVPAAAALVVQNLQAKSSYKITAAIVKPSRVRLRGGLFLGIKKDTRRKKGKVF